MTRAEWLSGIYQDMTGTLPPENFWETPSGQEIRENNPAWLYDQPTANLYQIIGELSPEAYTALLQQIRARQTNPCSDDEQLLTEAIRDSAARFFVRNRALFREDKRYPKAAEARRREIMRKRNAEKTVYIHNAPEEQRRQS